MGLIKDVNGTRNAHENNSNAPPVTHLKKAHQAVPLCRNRLDVVFSHFISSQPWNRLGLNGNSKQKNLEMA